MADPVGHIYRARIEQNCSRHKFYIFKVGNQGELKFTLVDIDLQKEIFLKRKSCKFFDPLLSAPNLI